MSKHDNYRLAHATSTQKRRIAYSNFEDVGHLPAPEDKANPQAPWQNLTDPKNLKAY